MTDDALKRLKRQKPSVPSRDASLTPPIPPSPSISVGTSKSRNLELKTPELNELKTKQTTMRLEATLSDRLQELCREHNISREVLIESLLIQFDGNPQIQTAVLTEAQNRHEQRTQAANRKRAQTMIERFGNP